MAAETQIATDLAAFGQRVLESIDAVYVFATRGDSAAFFWICVITVVLWLFAPRSETQKFTRRENND